MSIGFNQAALIAPLLAGFKKCEKTWKNKWKNTWV